jgi:Glycosyl transferase family 2
VPGAKACRLIRRIAVIVPAANEEQRIFRCLSSIATARTHLYGRDADIRAEIVVVLDACRDATGVIAAGFAGVRTMAITARSAGAARRAGGRAALAGGPAAELWLASTDADSEVPRDWLTAMAAEARHGADLVLGTVLPGPDLAPATRAEWLARHHLRDGHPHVHGANLGIRGHTYLALGGWQPLATGEDADLAGRAARAGYLRITRTASIPLVTSARRAGRAPGGFSSYLRALGTDAQPGHHQPDGQAEHVTSRLTSRPRLLPSSRNAPAPQLQQPGQRSAVDARTSGGLGRPAGCRPHRWLAP